MFPTCCFRQRTYVAQDYVNGVLNDTWAHSCLNGFRFSLGLCKGHTSLSFSLSVSTLVCSTPNTSLISKYIYIYIYIYNLSTTSKLHLVFSLVGQHVHVRIKGSIGEHYLWVRFCFSSSVPHVLFILFWWF